MNLHAQVHVLFKIITCITLTPIFFHLWIQILCFFFIKKDHPHISWKLKYIFVKCGLKIIKIKEWKKLNFYLWSLQYDFKCSINSINDDDQWNLNINIIKITDKLFTVEWYSTTLSLYPKKMQNPINIWIQAYDYAAAHFSPLIWGNAGTRRWSSTLIFCGRAGNWCGHLVVTGHLLNRRTLPKGQDLLCYTDHISISAWVIYQLHHNVCTTFFLQHWTIPST